MFVTTKLLTRRKDHPWKRLIWVRYVDGIHLCYDCTIVVHKVVITYENYISFYFNTVEAR